MATYILLIWAGIVCSVLAVLFLSFYYRLVRTANQTIGEIISFGRSSFIVSREILIPIVRFKAQGGSYIESQPEY